MIGQNPYANNGKPMLEELKAFFKRNDILTRLMVINISVFALINISGLLLYLFNIDREFTEIHGVYRLTYYLSLPSDLSSFLMRPWSLITYMFVQEGIFHLFFNMMILYVGGQIFNRFVGESKLLSTYILSGIAGAILYVLTFNIFPAFQNVVGGSFAIGSSASVLGIFIAAATFAPNLPMNVIFLGNVKLKYIAIVFIALDLLNIRNGNAGGHIAHLGGAFYGYLFSSQLKKNVDIGKSFNQLLLKLKSYFYSEKKKSSFKNVHKNPKRPSTDEDYLKNKNAHQAEIDQILDKIKRSGYESLTTMEKQKLFDASNRP